MSPLFFQKFRQSAVDGQSGFSLLEMAIAVGVSGMLMAGLWQMSGVADRAIQATTLATQATAVGAAAQAYLNINKSAVLALIPALNDVIRIKVVTGDSAGNTPSLQAAGLLSSDFVNANPYGQTYVFYVRREDAGVLGSADANDRLVGLVITSGGNALSDSLGRVSASRIGAAGGFMYSDENPASPTAATTIRGVADGWSIALGSSGWSGTVGATATAGHLAVYTPLLPTGVSPGSGGGASIDSLTDGQTDYSSLYNVFLGKDSGIASGTNTYSTATGYQALYSTNSGSGQSAFGYQALYSNSTGSRNSAFGSRALYSNTTGNDLTAMGFEALYANTTGSYNTAAGSYAMHSNQTGSYNTSAGYRSFYTSTSGDFNTALGAQALEAADGAIHNTAVGYQSLRNTTTGSYNTAAGAQSLLSNTTGSHNTALGYMSLSSIQMMDNNTAAGIYALRDSVLGTNNVAVGRNALLRNTTGSDNIAIGAYADDGSYSVGATIGSKNISIGYQALPSGCTSANNNLVIGSAAGGRNDCSSYMTAIGYRALYASNAASSNYSVAIGSSAWLGGGTETVAVGARTGYYSGARAGDYDAVIGFEAMGRAAGADSSVAAGHRALYSVTSGDGNVAVGVNALYSNKTGNYNTAIGYQTLYNSSTSSNLTAIGYFALYSNTTGADNTALGYASLILNNTGTANTAIGPAGLGNTTGSYNTALGDHSLYTNASGSRNTGIGCYSLSNLTGNDNTGLGVDALYSNTSGVGNTAVGGVALYFGSGSYNTSIGVSSGPTFGGGDPSNTTAIGYGAAVASSNEIRVGNTSVTSISGQVAWSFPSDRRDKHDIRDSDLGLDFLMSLRPVSYRLNNGDGLLDYGFIAQEVQQALGGRQTNMIQVKNDARGSLLFRSTDMISPVVRALQEQGQTLVRLKSELQDLRDLLSRLKAARGHGGLDPVPVEEAR